MNWKQPFREYFNFSRGERRGILVWAVIMVLFILAPSIYRLLRPDRPYDVSAFEAEINTFMQAAAPDVHDSPKGDPLSRYDSLELVAFDPNRNSYEDWLALGFTIRQARTADNYLKSGGKFNIPSDLKKIYGLDPGQFDILEPYIFIGGTSVDDNLHRETASPGVGLAKVFVPIEINSADSSTLLQLRGIGPVLASRLIKYRNLLGGFYSCFQLSEVYGLSDSIVASWDGMIWADTSLLRRIDLNRAEFRELVLHPYLDNYQARSILLYRNVQGRIDEPGEIMDNRLLPAEVYEKVRPYLYTKERENKD